MVWEEEEEEEEEKEEISIRVDKRRWWWRTRTRREEWKCSSQTPPLIPSDLHSHPARLQRSSHIKNLVRGWRTQSLLSWWDEERMMPVEGMMMTIMMMKLFLMTYSCELK